ncbi:MAG: hypothetical protein MR517_06570 [Bacteroidales bacterium]|nr:hypothetical protein [Bacteroidales bacterium]
MAFPPKKCAKNATNIGQCTIILNKEAVYFAYNTLVFVFLPDITAHFAIKAPRKRPFFSEHIFSVYFCNYHYIVHCFWNVRLSILLAAGAQSADFLIFRIKTHHKSLTLQRKNNGAAPLHFYHQPKFSFK